MYYVEKKKSGKNALFRGMQDANSFKKSKSHVLDHSGSFRAATPSHQKYLTYHTLVGAKITYIPYITKRNTVHSSNIYITPPPSRSILKFFK